MQNQENEKQMGHSRVLKFRAWNKDEKEMYLMEMQHPYRYFDIVNGREDEYIVMQYTGLLDKNGKEIYEGDIVLHSDLPGSLIYKRHKPKVVKWKQALGAYDMDVSEHVADQEAGAYESELIEVIGNIYENPELLENHG